jgi:hypothetical protein
MQNTDIKNIVHVAYSQSAFANGALGVAHCTFHISYCIFPIANCIPHIASPLPSLFLFYENMNSRRHALKGDSNEK